MSMYKQSANFDGEEAVVLDGNYRWEAGYEKTWEAIKEDTDGTLKASVDEIKRARKRLLASRIPNSKLGMMRHLYLVLDLSSAMNDKDLHPSRLHATLKLVENFIEAYFDQNPISQLGILASRNKRVEKVTDMTGNPQKHISAIRTLTKSEGAGEFSLQNGLETAFQTLKHVPAHTSREVLILMGSLSTCDPHDIHSTSRLLSTNAVKCSAIGLAAEVSIARQLCQSTGGRYNVILDENHFKDLLKSHAIPQTSSSNISSSLIQMGFPNHQSSGSEKPSMCVCHQDSVGGPQLTTKGYSCPQCLSKYCELPVECQVCGLILVSAPHIARSYHHLFPISQFEEVMIHQDDADMNCSGCMCLLERGKSVFRCGDCYKIFCIDCDIFLHEVLHSCPSCSCSISTIR